MKMRDVRKNASEHGFYKMENERNGHVRYFVGRVIRAFLGNSRMSFTTEIEKRQGKTLENEGLIPQKWKYT